MGLSRAEERQRERIRCALEAAEDVRERLSGRCYLEDGAVLNFDAKRPWVELPDGRRVHLHPIPRERMTERGPVLHRRMVIVKNTEATRYGDQA